MAYLKPISAGLCASVWPNTNAAGFVKSVYAELDQHAGGTPPVEFDNDVSIYGSTKVVNITIGTVGMSCLRARLASVPFMTGIARSITIRSEWMPWNYRETLERIVSL